MQDASSTHGTAPAMLVISCSDARFARENAQPSWKRRLNFAGEIFELRCPGGGIALADRGSSFYQSAFDSFSLLNASRRITGVVLAFHEDCAYFSDKYGSAGSLPADVESRKWSLADEAVRNVKAWSETLQVRTLYTRFVANRAVDDFVRHQRAHADGRSHPGHHHAHFRGPQPAAPQRQALVLAPSERATLQSFDRQVEERLLRTNENIDDVIAAAEAQAREAGTTPAWRIEMRAREFIDLLRRDGRKDLKKNVHAFVHAYAEHPIPRSVLRAIMTELDEHMQAKPGRDKA